MKDELKNIEIALIASDISKINIDYKRIKAEAESLQKELAGMTSKNTEDNTKLEKLKTAMLKIAE